MNGKYSLKTEEAVFLFTDEGNSFVKTEKFAKAVRGSDNYFVLITRENLYNLPYSVEEIYGIRSSGKYQKKKLNEVYLHEINKIDFSKKLCYFKNVT